MVVAADNDGPGQLATFYCLLKRNLLRIVEDIWPVTATFARTKTVTTTPAVIFLYMGGIRLD